MAGKPIDLRGLREICRGQTPERNRVARLFEHLKGPLAEAWLRSDVLARMIAHRAELYGVENANGEQPASTEADLPARGRCRLLLVTSNHHELTLLRPAFVLPVDWREVKDAGGSSPRLPAGLANFAAELLADLGLDGLSLHLPESWERAGVDLSGLEFSPPSAWAALAAGAVIFREHGATVPTVLASAAWSRELDGGKGSIAAVEGVEEKCEAASQAWAEFLFVPRANEKDVRRWREREGRLAGSLPQIRWLSNELTSPQRALQPLLEVLEVPPRRANGDSFDRRCDYHARMPLNGSDEYYREELLDDACQRLKDRLPSDPRLQGVRKLAFIASPSRSVPCLFATLFDPGQVLLLHDGELEASVIADCRRDLADVGRGGRPAREVMVQQCRPEALQDDILRHLQAFEAAHPAGRLLVDLTPGYRAFNLALLAAAPPTAVLAYVHSPQAKGPSRGRVRAGNEELRVVEL